MKRYDFKAWLFPLAVTLPTVVKFLPSTERSISKRSLLISLAVVQNKAALLFSFEATKRPKTTGKGLLPSVPVKKEKLLRLGALITLAMVSTELSVPVKADHGATNIKELSNLAKRISVSFCIKPLQFSL